MLCITSACCLLPLATLQASELLLFTVADGSNGMCDFTLLQW